MTREELKSLTIEQLNSLTEQELDVIAQEVIEYLSDSEINQLPKDVREVLKITKEKSSFFSKEFWITVIVGALIMSLVQVILGS